MKNYWILLCVFWMAYSIEVPPPEKPAEVEQAAHGQLTIYLEPQAGGASEPTWHYVPTNDLAIVLGDYNAPNPNASYVEILAPNAVHDDYVVMQPPTDLSCALIGSIQSVTVQWKLHTGAANEDFYADVFDEANHAEATWTCGTLRPWRPVGTVLECGRSTRPGGGVWTKADIGCEGFGPSLVVGFELAPRSGIVMEAQQVRINATSL